MAVARESALVSDARKISGRIAHELESAAQPKIGLELVESSAGALTEYSTEMKRGYAELSGEVTKRLTVAEVLIK